MTFADTLNSSRSGGEAALHASVSHGLLLLHILHMLCLLLLIKVLLLTVASGDTELLLVLLVALHAHSVHVTLKLQLVL